MEQNPILDLPINEYVQARMGETLIERRIKNAFNRFPQGYPAHMSPGTERLHPPAKEVTVQKLHKYRTIGPKAIRAISEKLRDDGHPHFQRTRHTPTRVCHKEPIEMRLERIEQAKQIIKVMQKQIQELEKGESPKLITAKKELGYFIYNVPGYESNPDPR